jgi:solute carrier family 35 protein C2
VYNKWLMNEYRGGFKYPLLITCVHMSVKYILSKGVFVCGISKTVVEPISSYRTLITVVMIGVCTSGDIALSNEGVMLVTLTLYTTMKSTVLVFTYFWTLVLGLEHFDWKVFASISLISFGVSLSVSAATDVNLQGVLCVVGASCLGGLRWALMQTLVTADRQSKDDVFVALLRFAPYSAIAMYPVVLFLEDLPRLVDTSSRRTLYDYGFLSLAGGFIAFALIIVEVKLVKMVSSLSMGVFGQLKEVTQIFLSMMVFHDHLSLSGGVGIFIALCGAQIYKSVHSHRIVEDTPHEHGSPTKDTGMIDRAAHSPTAVSKSSPGSNGSTISPPKFRFSEDIELENMTKGELDLLLPSDTRDIAI